MPKVISPAEQDAVLDAVAQHAGGVGIDALHRQLPQWSRRTLQRRLADLVAREQLRATGQGRGLRYQRPPNAIAELPPAGHPAAEPGPQEAIEGVPLTPEAAQVRALVQQPLARRNPVGYQRDFLDRYIPNQTRYLPDDLRQRLLGWGQSLAGGQPAGTYARDIHNRLLVDLAWASSRLEGNTYTRLDTQNLIDFGMAAEGKDQLETQMILNHKAAIEMLVGQAGEIGFNAYTFCNLHALLSENLLADPGASGRVRNIPVGITGTVYQPTAIPQLIDECFLAILDKAAAIDDPFEQAFFIMVHIPYLQPFEDVNKRVSRLGANIPLIRNNLSPLSFVDVPEAAYTAAMRGIYELNRIELLRDVFVWAYERSCQRYTLIKDALPQPDPLRLRYRNELREVVREMVQGHWPITPEVIRQLTADRIPGESMPAFVAMVASELHHLHPGNLMRYGLRPTEFEAWKQNA